jgi:hypothetical protein
MSGELIVDFPRRQRQRSVHFADTDTTMAQVHIIEPYGDVYGESVARHELWYTSAEYARMQVAVKEDVLEVWRMSRAGVPMSYAAGNHDRDTCDCWMGIEYLLSRASVNEVRACRARCVRAVLEEQDRQMNDPSARLRFRWDAIALASLSQTRRAALRARKLGKMHHDSI